MYQRKLVQLGDTRLACANHKLETIEPLDCVRVALAELLRDGSKRVVVGLIEMHQEEDAALAHDILVHVAHRPEPAPQVYTVVPSVLHDLLHGFRAPLLPAATLVELVEDERDVSGLDGEGCDVFGLARAKDAELRDAVVREVVPRFVDGSAVGVVDEQHAARYLGEGVMEEDYRPRWQLQPPQRELPA